MPTISQLEQLSRTLYAREYTAIRNTNFPSNSDTLRCYEFAKEAQDSVAQLCEMEKTSIATPQETPTQREACEETCKYIRSFALFAIRGIRNMKTRFHYIEKLKEIATEELTKISSGDLTSKELEAVTEQAIHKCNLALELTRAKRKPNSEAFSEVLKRDGMTYKQLCNRYSSLRYHEQFCKLDTGAKKALVLFDIIEASGRVARSVLTDLIGKILGDINIMNKVFFSAGMIVWDVATSSHPLLTAVKDVWTAVGKAIVSTTLSQLSVDELAGAAIRAGLVAEEVAEADAAGMLILSGIVTTGGPFLIVAAAGIIISSLFDLLFDALSLHIPAELKYAQLTLTPLDSPLFNELSTLF